MNGIVYHIVSGQSFYSGIALILLAAWLSANFDTRHSRYAASVFLVGLAAVLLSSTPIPVWLIALISISTLAWTASRWKIVYRVQSAFAVAGMWTLAAMVEIPYLLPPQLQPVNDRRLTVIGDSVTAGVGDKIETWPSLLSRQHSIRVQDLSHVGDTAEFALNRFRNEPIESELVLVEIGGNDVLGGTTVGEFEIHLDRLLKHLSTNNRQVVMFELPLPPLYHRYAIVQRAAAVRHGVQLIPKRHFASVIAGTESTLDSIHLSQSGHERMAGVVWRMIGAAFD